MKKNKNIKEVDCDQVVKMCISVHDVLGSISR